MASRKGKPNKATATREAALEKGGIMPLAFMLDILRDETQCFENRKWAAQNAAPYSHPRLSQIDAHHTGQLDIRGWLMSLGEPKD